MNLLSALALQLIGFTSVTLAQYPIKDEPAKASTYDYCQANVINPEKYTPLFPEGELLSVQLFHRHGDRSPSKFIPPKLQVQDTWNCAAEVRTPTFKPLGSNRTLHGMYINQCEDGAGHCGYNPVKRNSWKGNCYDGQLTPKGMDQLAETGKKFREVYVNKLKFLPENWSDARKQMYFRATNWQRTEQSTASIFTGWYALKEGELNQEPIHFEVFPSQFEVMTPDGPSCPKLKKLNVEFKKSVEYAIYQNNTKELRNYFNSFIKQDLSADMWTSHWQDVLVSRSCHGMKPICVEDKNNSTKCMTEASLKSVQQAGIDEYKLWYGANSLRKEGITRLQIGSMLWEIKNNLIKAPTTLLKGDLGNYPRLKVYSGHDSTLGPLLSALNAKGADWPPYASTISFELWNPKKNDANSNHLDLSLRIIYNGEPMDAIWCPNGVCKVRDYLVYIRDELGLVDPSIANLGTDPKAKTWDYYDECNEDY